MNTPYDETLITDLRVMISTCNNDNYKHKTTKQR